MDTKSVSGLEIDYPIPRKCADSVSIPGIVELTTSWVGHNYY